MTANTIYKYLKRKYEPTAGEATGQFKDSVCFVFLFFWGGGVRRSDHRFTQKEVLSHVE